jgi:hypothetical protein
MKKTFASHKDLIGENVHVISALPVPVVGMDEHGETALMVGENRQPVMQQSFGAMLISEQDGLLTLEMRVQTPSSVVGLSVEHTSIVLLPSGSCVIVKAVDKKNLDAPRIIRS